MEKKKLCEVFETNNNNCSRGNGMRLGGRGCGKIILHISRSKKSNKKKQKSISQIK